MLKNHHLIQATIKGDYSAFEKLYQLHAPRLMGVCIRYASDADDAKDILQDAFIKIFEKLSSFRTDGSFEAWIRKITIHVALDNYRKRMRENTISIDNHFTEYNSPSTIEDSISQLSVQELVSLVQKLPPRYRMVFNLYVFEGYKHTEIAEMLGITEGTSKSNLSDARRILKQKVLSNV